MKGEEENVFKEGDQGRFERNNGRGAKRSGTASFLQVIGEKPFKTFNKGWACLTTHHVNKPGASEEHADRPVGLGVGNIQQQLDVEVVTRGKL